jgi:hypothetical protein
MLELVIDPVLLAPPSDGDSGRWTERLRGVGSLISQSGLRATCGEQALNQAIALWYSQTDASTGAAPHELALVAHEYASRLAAAPKCAAGQPLVDKIRTDPGYTPAQVDETGRAAFTEHLGEAAVAKQDGGMHVGILGPSDSWEQEVDSVLVEGEILGREDDETGLVESREAEAVLREFLDRSGRVGDVLKRLCDQPCTLLRYPELGVRALWATQFGGDPWQLDFEVSPTFAMSVIGLNFHNRSGEARRCLRVMAQIAGGRAEDIDGHEERESGAATSPVQKDRRGNKVMRSYLQNRVPDAHRLFWARGAKPIFLNVSGHEGGPAV